MVYVYGFTLVYAVCMRAARGVCSSLPWYNSVCRRRGACRCGLLC